MNLRFFEGKRILITGASGYIGQNLVDVLSRVNCTLLRGSRQTKSLGDTSAISAARVINLELDYLNANIWDEVLLNVDIVFHLAAQTNVYEADKDPVQDFQVNVLPLLNILKSCETNRYKPTIIFSGTATQTGLCAKLPVVEKSYEHPVTIYDIHKLMCEKYLTYYAEKGIINSCTLRLSNVFGPGVKSSNENRGVLNMMIQRGLDKQALTIYGEGKELRDYVFIDDVIQAFLVSAIYIDQVNAQHFNIGSGVGTSLVDAFSLISQVIEMKSGYKPEVLHVDVPTDLSPIEKRNFIADISVFREKTRWMPTIGLEVGINKTIDYHLNKLH